MNEALLQEGLDILLALRSNLPESKSVGQQFIEQYRRGYKLIERSDNGRVGEQIKDGDLKPASSIIRPIWKGYNHAVGQRTIESKERIYPTALLKARIDGILLRFRPANQEVSEIGFRQRE